MTKINHYNLSNYLKERFSDRDHAQSKHVLEIMDELLKEGIDNIEDLEALVNKYPPDEYFSKMEHEMGFRLADIGVIRSLLAARKIDEINSIIDSWKPLPTRHERLQDTHPFVNIGGGIASYLMKSGNNIKIYTTDIGELEISFDELGNRIGTGLPYLRRLKGRLEAFQKILSSNQERD
jgi:hypothetical protein